MTGRLLMRLGIRCIMLIWDKALIATTFGRKPLSEGVRINGAHIDSPRLV